MDISNLRTVYKAKIAFLMKRNCIHHFDQIPTKNLESMVINDEEKEIIEMALQIFGNCGFSDKEAARIHRAAGLTDTDLMITDYRLNTQDEILKVVTTLRIVHLGLAFPNQ